jgi:hypothetical protein
MALNPALPFWICFFFYYYYLVCEAIVPASGDSEDDCGEADRM